MLRVFRRIVQEYGLPERIRTDNVAPFATCSFARLSGLAVWWLRRALISTATPTRFRRASSSATQFLPNLTSQLTIIAPTLEQERAQDAEEDHETLGGQRPGTAGAGEHRGTPTAVGAREGVGKAYLQAVLDCFSRHACGPQSNGFIERFHRTLLDEHLRIAGRTKCHESVEEMQQGLDAYLESHHRKRPHRGRGMDGRTPCQVFEAGLTKAKQAAEQARMEEPKSA